TAPVQNGTGIAVGEARWYLWDGSVPQYLNVANNASGGGGSFTNPMPNNTYLEGEDTSATAHDLVGVDGSDNVLLGNSAQQTRVRTSAAGLIIVVGGTNRYLVDDTALAPISDNARALGAPTTRWAGLYNSGLLS